MKLIVDIDKEVYRAIKSPLDSGGYYDSKCFDAIWNGIPLPEGCGDLKDELDLDLFAPSLGTDKYIDDLMTKHKIDYVNGDDEDKVRAFALDLIHSCMNVIETAPTIIEADKEELNEDSN